LRLDNANSNSTPASIRVHHLPSDKLALVLAEEQQTATNPIPRDTYAARLTARNTLLTAANLRRDRIGYLRLLVFAAIATVGWYIFHGLAILWILLPLAAFTALMWWQSRMERDAECARRAIRFYERAIARLENRWHDDPQDEANSGSRFIDPHHPCASDLSLFGHASLFHLLSTARTRGGEERLAGWLKSASSPTATTQQLLARHEAIDELRPLLDVREDIAVLGDDYRVGVDPAHLVAWASKPAQPFPAWKRIAAFFLSLAIAAILVWWFATNLESPDARLTLVITAAIAGLFALPMRNRILEIAHSVEAPARDLELLSQLLAVLEKQHFRSPLLAEIRKAIEVDDRAASQRIRKLRHLVEMLDSRDNVFVRTFGPLLLWTTQLGMAIEAWRADNGPHVAKWLDAVSEIEALSSLANYAWEHPDDPFPEFASTPSVFEGEELGHPLIAPGKCVRNSVRLDEPLRLLVVSGSNMSGKSTLLRTIGVNAVLALAGAPVRAKRLRLSPMSLGASITTTDSLEEGYSRFMAEVMRLKQILELPAPSLFLLDELLGGTNSHDRALGSEGLVRALLSRGAIGLITTHDLSLTRVADELVPAAANVHFEDRLVDGRLVFDYKIRPGIVERSNALDLMRAVGLDV
jgi:hypothetical protein